MLSILIPEHNFDCRKLVRDLSFQCNEAEITYEIIVLDDASNLFLIENRQILNLPFCSFVEVSQNHGAARTRNTLVSMASYQFILMIDCDAEIPDEFFIDRYLENLGKADVVIGGLEYSPEKPSPEKYLRWFYGKHRECIPSNIRNKKPYQSLFSFQFLTTKEIMQKHPFDETVKDYGHEDTILGHEFQKDNISILYIDNPLIHIGLDDSPVFLQKSLLAARKYLTNPIFKNKEIAQTVKLFRFFQIIKKWRMRTLGAKIYLALRNRMTNNILGKNPNLFVFDCYRLGYLCFLDLLESKEDK
jgi:glycosyltransferase involved in cell wall biosynthesis